MHILRSFRKFSIPAALLVLAAFAGCYAKQSVHDSAERFHHRAVFSAAIDNLTIPGAPVLSEFVALSKHPLIGYTWSDVQVLSTARLISFDSSLDVNSYQYSSFYVTPTIHAP